MCVSTRKYSSNTCSIAYKFVLLLKIESLLCIPDTESTDSATLWSTKSGTTKVALRHVKIDVSLLCTNAFKLALWNILPLIFSLVHIIELLLLRLRHGLLLFCGQSDTLRQNALEHILDLLLHLQIDFKSKLPPIFIKCDSVAEASYRGPTGRTLCLIAISAIRIEKKAIKGGYSDEQELEGYCTPRSIGNQENGEDCSTFMCKISLFEPTHEYMIHQCRSGSLLLKKTVAYPIVKSAHCWVLLRLHLCQSTFQLLVQFLHAHLASSTFEEIVSHRTLYKRIFKAEAGSMWAILWTCRNIDKINLGCYFTTTRDL